LPVYLRSGTGATPVGRGSGDAALAAGAYRRRSADLGHEIVIPVALDREVSGSAQFGGFDQVVVHVGVHAGLPEGVERSSGRATSDEPGLKILGGRVGELAFLPHIVPVTADQVRAGVTVALAVDDQD